MPDLRAKVLTVSDGVMAGTRENKSGVALVNALSEAGYEITDRRVVGDGVDAVTGALREMANGFAGVIVTTGGTGFGPRDNTPEATLQVIDREAPGLAEAMRMETLKQTPMAMISRGVCGIRSGTLIVNLPGSPKAVRESFEIIRPVLSHAVALLEGNTSH